MTLRFRRYLLLIVVLPAMLIFNGCAMTSVREHPDFASKTRQVKNIVVLPTDVEVLYLVLTGDNERLPEDEKKVKTTLASSLPGLLEKRGYQVVMIDAEKSEQIFKDASFTIEQAKSAYKDVSKQLYENDMVEVEEAKKFRVSIGPIGTAVAEALNADAFLFTRYAGFKKSDGLIAKQVVSGALLGALTGVVVIPVPTGGSLEMALIDGHSGDVLWTNRGGAGHVVPEALAKNLLAKLSATGSVAEAEKAKTLAKATVAAEAAQ